ncbi:MAG: EpsG family protein [Bacillota bacterium]|nr:EpsG family protein [Bacillota bacterium]
MIKILTNPLYINIFLLLLEGAFILKNKRLKNGRKLFVVLASTQWIIISGLRHLTIGEDTLNYLGIYEITLGIPLSEIFTDISQLFLGGAHGIESGYYIFQRLTQMVFPEYQFFLFVIALIFHTALGVWIFKYSRDPLISFLIYSTLFYYFFAFTGHRQTVATALVVLIGYKYVRERKLISFCIITLFAFAIHKSAILFLPFYFIANQKLTRNKVVLALMIFPILMFFRDPIATAILKLSWYNYGLYDGGGTYVFTSMLVLVTIASIWKMKRILLMNTSAVHYINALIIALILTPFTWFNPSAMRVVQYYSLFLVFLVPEIFAAFNSREKVLVYFGGIGIILLLFARNNPQYLFFWQ